MPFTFEQTAIPQVVLIEPRVFSDARGFFMEVYRQSEFLRSGIKGPFLQQNHSRSTKGILRGLHYQKSPKAQGKLVRAVAGEIFDVAVDLRREAPTFARWVGARLSAENRKMLYIPPWCAHGFCVLSDVAEVIYLTTEEYAPELEAGVIWNDPAIGIEWPIHSPVLSPRDLGWPALSAVTDAFTPGPGA